MIIRIKDGCDATYEAKLFNFRTVSALATGLLKKSSNCYALKNTKAVANSKALVSVASPIYS